MHRASLRTDGPRARISLLPRQSSTIILQGSADSVTPLSGVKRFCDRMVAAGNVCELHVYEGFGHLFTPAGVPDGGQPRPDPATRADALAKAELFLKSLGYIR